MELFPMQEALLEGLNIQKSPVKEAKVIWGQRSGKSLCVDELYRRDGGLQLRLVESLGTYDDEDVSGAGCIEFTELEDLLNFIDVAQDKKQVISSIVVLELDWILLDDDPLWIYGQIKNALTVYVEDEGTPDSVKLVFIGSLGQENRTHSIMNGTGVEWCMPTWAVNPNVTYQQLGGEFSCDAKLAARDFGSYHVD